MTEPGRETLKIDASPGYQTWTMCAEPVNALSPALLSALDDALTATEADETVAVAVLTSSLKVFSAGADATWMAQEAEAHGVDALLETFNYTMDRFRALSIRIRQSPLLVIAAMNGHTLAGGLELAAACDMRFCADRQELRIGVPEMDLFGALPSGGGGVQFLNRLMTPSQALTYILDAKPVSPQTAKCIGLVDRLYDVEELLPATQKFALEVASKAGRIGVAAAKRAVFTGAEIPFQEAQILDHSLHWDTMRRGNFKRGVGKFTEQFASRSS